MAYDPHEPLDSFNPLTSISSCASVETYESLKAEIANVEQSQTSLQDLVNAADKIINERFAPESQSTFTCGRESETISVDLAAVMRAMLACARECGGEEGKRYVASAVIACSRNGEGVEGLAALGTTWLTHLLFVFKTTHDGSGVGNKQRSFRNDVKIRDGYQCLLTGWHDESHPALDESIPVTWLTACHILPRAIGFFDIDQTSDSAGHFSVQSFTSRLPVVLFNQFKSAATTFDLLVNFTRLPVETLEDLQDRLDDPSNGMLLDGTTQAGFDRFNWCLKKTDVANEYTPKILRNVSTVLIKPEGTPVLFRDHSNDVTMDSTCKRKNRPVPLPNAHYIAIHAAIAEILHTSGAGKFFNEILNRYKHRGELRLVRCWPELERMMEIEQLREAIIESFQAVRGH